MKLTGMEGPRDLEVLYHLATVGELDDTVAKRKFGKAVRPAIHVMINLGHPIRMERSVRAPHHWRYQWIPLLP